jgi:ParB family transcriptional regulator, chromosome partitioning protein
MKRPFNLGAITADLPSLPEEGRAMPEATRSKFPAVPIARAIETQHRNALAELRALEDSLEKSKAAGLMIEQIDPALADPSPYWDRDIRFLQDASFTSFIDDIRRNGQQSPALLRPHPTVPGRYEVCFGHRRLFACRSLGLLLQAVVKPLTEAQMAGGAYSENTHRDGVSILEQARALARYVERGVFPSKQALADALSVSRSHVSNLTSYAEIPEVVLSALGDWRKCTFREAQSLLKAVRDERSREAMLTVAQRLAEDESPLSLHARLGLLIGRATRAGLEKDEFRDAHGRKLAERRRGKYSVGIAFALDRDENFGDFVWEKLPTLADQFVKTRKRRP